MALARSAAPSKAAALAALHLVASAHALLPVFTPAGDAVAAGCAAGDAAFCSLAVGPGGFACGLYTPFGQCLSACGLCGGAAEGGFEGVDLVSAANATGEILTNVTGSNETEAAAGCGTIDKVAASAGVFSSLLGAVDAALADPDFKDNVAPALSDPEAAVTVFAPTDDADWSAAGGLTPEQVAQVLQYHIVGGTVDATDGQEVTTLEGGPLSLEGADVVGACNTAAIQGEPISACAATIYVIDAVLIPGAFCTSNATNTTA
mmetsp:Transcript_7767/g.22064  ORF Transcript_7767/g.22064 Transcript_7767/m.22064 type:complete len:262 (-) Transcript_7767:331-1116(-)